MASLRRIRRLGDSKGTNMVEAAIITPLLLLLTFSIVDFGSFFHAYLALENGVSQATRYGVTGNFMDDPAHPGTPLSRENSMRTAMRQAAPSLTLPDNAFVFEHQVSGATSWVAGTGGPGDIERLTVNYSWSFFTPTMRAFFANGKINLSVTSMMKNESRFN